MQGIPGDIVRKITGHRSRELERYQHLSPLFRAQTVDLIAQVLVGDTPTDTPAPEEEQDDANLFEELAGWTGLEPATSDVTGRRSNQLNYHPAKASRTCTHGPWGLPGRAWWAVEDSNL